MPIQLHPDCRHRILELTAKGLPHIIANNAMFPDRISCLMAFVDGEMALPEKGKVRDQLVAYVDDHPLLSFFSDILGRELWLLDKYDQDKPKARLIDIDGYGDTAALAERLVRQLESLPWQYTWSLRFPDDLGKAIRTHLPNVKLGPSIQIVCPTQDTNNELPLKSADEKLNKRVVGGPLLGLFSEDPKWDTDGAYLQLQTAGYIGQYGGTLPADEAKRTMKAFIGLGLALHLFEVDYSLTSGRFLFSASSEIYVHKLHEGVWQIDNKLELEEAEARALSSIKLHTLGGKLDTADKKAGWANVTLGHMKDVFSSDDDTASIKLAAQWLFDSYVGTDELLSFVRAMVVLEILLGDKAASDEIGLGELLRNRCAYLISKTHDERMEVMRDFNEIYKVRSKIVHQGKHRLSAHERGLFNKLRWMCRRVITEEVTLLRSTIDSKRDRIT